MKNQVIDKIAPVLTEVMIKKIENLSTQWNKPWLTCVRPGNMPRNLRGTAYSGANILTLAFLCEQMNYTTPVFMTFNQAKEEELTVVKGSKSFPVYYFLKYVFDPQTRESIPYEAYVKLSDGEKERYKVLPSMRYYNVFNVDQTDFAEKYPERYAALTRLGEPQDLSDGFRHEQLDRMLVANEWYCPITLQFSDRAYYQPAFDRIVCPEKRQFPNGVQFYGTLMHEMAHSTGHESRLKRDVMNSFGSRKYAREELVAELTAALSGIMLGVTATLQDENAAYLKSWLKNMKEEPKFLMEILKDVTRATGMLTGRVNEFAEKCPKVA